jgi:hypothetical protein
MRETVRLFINFEGAQLSHFLQAAKAMHCGRMKRAAFSNSRQDVDRNDASVFLLNFLSVYQYEYLQIAKKR